jgi:serine/threonine protein kinase
MLPLTPTRLGRYEIVDEIGKGAMGVVYLARDPLIGRLVALKTFRIGYSIKDAELDQFRARFIREAQSAGILSHPNIVTIHDVVERSDEGLAFIAMEYVRGTNLKTVLQQDRRPTLPYVSDIVGQIGAGLDYAHSCKVVHRDIKPANILITADNRVKITDFGIARLDTSNLTQEGQLLGTPNYMSPEQILGREVDHRADIFALGVVLYEMVTRHKPFQGENLTVVSHRIVYDHFTPPQAYVDDLPAGIDKIISRALEKDPARRYQAARELGDDLRRVANVTLTHEMLNETQSLSSTVVVAADLAAPAAPPSAAAPQSWAGTQRSDPSWVGTQHAASASRTGSSTPAASAAGSRQAGGRRLLPGRWWRGLGARAAPQGSSLPVAAPPSDATNPPAPAQSVQPAPPRSHPILAARSAHPGQPGQSGQLSPPAEPPPRATSPAAFPLPPEPGVDRVGGSPPGWDREDAAGSQPGIGQTAGSQPGYGQTAGSLPGEGDRKARSWRWPGHGWARGGARPPLRRLLIVAGVVAAGSLLLGWGALLLIGRGGPAAPQTATADLKRFQLLALLRQASQLLEAGDPQGAVAAYRAAQTVTPDRPGLRRRLGEAEQRQRELSNRIDQEKQIGSKIEEAKQALDERRYDDALAAAETVLQASPGNTVAEEVQASVRKARARAKERAAPATARQAAGAAEQGGAPRPDQARGTDPQAAAALGAGRAAEAKDATLEVTFFSDLSAGTLIIYANDSQLMRQSFRFQKRGVLFLSKPDKGGLGRKLPIHPGNVTLKVYVTPNGRAAQVKVVAGEFPAGGTRRLDIKLSEAGEVTARLD